MVPIPRALDDRSVPPTRPAVTRSTTAKVVFHGVGVAVLLIGAVVAFGAMSLAAFATSTCGPDLTDPERVGELRRALVVIALVLGSMPATWAALARLGRFAWMPWASVAFVVVLGGTGLALTVDEVSRWCF